MDKGKDKIFRFRQFSLQNSRSAMKVGTDGVLLGAWVDINMPARRVLDVGAGTGLIALMLAQRFAAEGRHPEITALEIDSEAADECRTNAEASPWADMVKIVNSDFANFTDEGFDLIVSNPPFFKEEVLSPEASRSLARHASTLSPLMLIEFASRSLSPEGSLSMIAPASMQDEIEYAATFNRLSISRLVDVITRPGVQPKRQLWEIAREATPLLRDTIYIGDNKYKEITSVFYLDK